MGLQKNCHFICHYLEFVLLPNKYISHLAAALVTPLRYLSKHTPPLLRSLSLYFSFLPHYPLFPLSYATFLSLFIPLLQYKRSLRCTCSQVCFNLKFILPRTISNKKYATYIKEKRVTNSIWVTILRSSLILWKG